MERDHIFYSVLGKGGGAGIAGIGFQMFKLIKALHSYATG